MRTQQNCRHPLRKSPPSRRGAVTIMAALLCMVLLGVVAFAVDIGYILSSKEEIQRTADAAALAATWEFAEKIGENSTPEEAMAYAREQAFQFSASNPVGNEGPIVETNAGNSPEGDLVFGYINDFSNPNAPFDTTSVENFNAVRVKVRRDATLNGELPLFFARVFGHDSQAVQSQATAALARSVSGFRVPSDGSNVMILPITLYKGLWEEWKSATTADGWKDDWAYHKESKSVVSGSDDFIELNLYPRKDEHPAGGFGMVDIGSASNSTSDIARQILHGVSESDLNYHGGTIELDDSGILYLNGDTGISAGVKDELRAISGEPRIIPIFEEVSGPGNNATYTICAWQGVRVMEVDLTGAEKNKKVVIQMGPTVGRGYIPSTSTSTSDQTFSPVILIE